MSASRVNDNDRQIRTHDPVRDLRRRIVQALHHNADLDARHIDVSLSGGTAILTGTVSSWLQRDCAEQAVSGAPGLSHVDNRIVVEPPPGGSAVRSADDLC